VPNENVWILYFVCCHFDWQLEITGNGFASWIHAWGFRASWGCYLVRGLFGKEVSLMNIEMIPILLFAWFVELTQIIQANAGLLFFLPLFTLVWIVCVLSVMRKWDAK
jgi:hypothetical protein